MVTSDAVAEPRWYGSALHVWVVVQSSLLAYGYCHNQNVDCVPERRGRSLASRAVGRLLLERPHAAEGRNFGEEIHREECRPVRTLRDWGYRLKEVQRSGWR